MTKQEQPPVPGVRTQPLDWYDRPEREQERCEMCGGTSNMSFPDPLCYDCSMGRDRSTATREP